MPDSYGKRQRNVNKAKKFAAREERRISRKQQKADEAAGIIRPSPDDPDGAAVDADQPVLDADASLEPASDGATREPSADEA